MSDDYGHHGTIAPFLFCVATAVMFIGLVMATAGGEDKTGDTGYWFIFFFGLAGMLTGFMIWVQDYWNQTSEESEEIEVYHEFWGTITTRKFGMWIFLLTEVMVFSTLLSAYLRYRAAVPDYDPTLAECVGIDPCWVPAADVIRSHLIFGIINTFALLLSSLTVVLALYAAKNNNPKATTRYLFATLVLGSIFLVLKLWEWGEMKNGHFWGEECSVTVGQDIANHCIAPKYEHGFWLDTSLEGSTFYITTGTHGAHVFIGLIALVYLIAKANKDGYNEEYHDTIELFGLYWHYVDLVWVFVFPFFYLY
jgi:cytochrome c oxidase subunit I+III|tara:strand:- start:9062 stop:9985 length:924 start_codon:yes stop_codon:yes gene_type:complete